MLSLYRRVSDNLVDVSKLKANITTTYVPIANSVEWYIYILNVIQFKFTFSHLA